MILPVAGRKEICSMFVFGFILGIATAFVIAYTVTMKMLEKSNALGDSKGSYEQFTGGKMTFISKS